MAASFFIHGKAVWLLLTVLQSVLMSAVWMHAKQFRRQYSFI